MKGGVMGGPYGQWCSQGRQGAAAPPALTGCATANLAHPPPDAINSHLVSILICSDCG